MVLLKGVVKHVDLTIAMVKFTSCGKMYYNFVVKSTYNACSSIVSHKQSKNYHTLFSVYVANARPSSPLQGSRQTSRW